MAHTITWRCAFCGETWSDILGSKFVQRKMERRRKCVHCLCLAGMGVTVRQVRALAELHGRTYKDVVTGVGRCVPEDAVLIALDIFGKGRGRLTVLDGACSVRGEADEVNGGLLFRMAVKAGDELLLETDQFSLAELSYEPVACPGTTRKMFIIGRPVCAK